MTGVDFRLRCAGFRDRWAAETTKDGPTSRQEPPRTTKDGPRAAQEPPRGPQKAPGAAKRPPGGPPEPQKPAKPNENQWFLRGFVKRRIWLPRAAPEPPKEAQERPKRRPGQSKRGQEGPRAGPREAQEPPRAAPEAHGSGPGRPRDVPGGAGSGPGAAQGTRRRPGGPRKAPRMRKPLVFTRCPRLRTPKVTGWPRFSSEECSQTEVFRGSTRPNHVIYEGFLTAEARNPPQEAPKRLPEAAGTRPEWRRPEETRGGKT